MYIARVAALSVTSTTQPAYRPAVTIVWPPAARQVTIKDGSGREQLIKDKMGGGEYFGERALLQSEPRNATITVTSEQAIPAPQLKRSAKALS